MMDPRTSAPRPPNAAPARPNAAPARRSARPLAAVAMIALTMFLAACGTTGPGGVITDGFEIDVARDDVVLATGNSTTVQVDVQRAAAFDEPIDVTVDGLPSGVMASQLTIGAGQTSAALLLTVDASADPVVEDRITVTATAGGFSDTDSFTLTVTDPGEGDPVDAIDAEVTAAQGTEAVLADEPSAADFVLEPGEDRLYRVTIPSSDEPALYLYLDQALDMYVYRGSGSLFATSSSPDFFAAGGGGVGVAGGAATVDPQIVVNETCPGSCVLMENPGPGVVYVRVHNPSSTTQSFTLWAVLRSFADENEAIAAEDEPQNFETSAEGAIETIGDTDYFIVDQAGTLAFEYAGDAGLDLQAQIIPFDESAPVETIVPGGSATVDFSDRVVVTATNPRAAVAANSQYDLFFQ